MKVATHSGGKFTTLFPPTHQYNLQTSGGMPVNPVDSRKPRGEICMIDRSIRLLLIEEMCMISHIIEKIFTCFLIDKRLLLHK